jgi:hypothetical protein
MPLALKVGSWWPYMYGYRLCGILLKIFFPNSSLLQRKKRGERGWHGTGDRMG